MSTLYRILAWVVVIGGAICAIIYYAYADVWVLPTDDARLLVSVEPTLRGGDTLLVARHGPPVLGDLVRCVDPDEPRRWVVGRVIGESNADLKVTERGFSNPGSREKGDTACEREKLINPANGDEVDLACRNEEFAGIAYQTLSRESSDGDHPVQVRVPPGKFYLFSDDRYLHLDSRDFGSVQDSSCQHIIFRLWGAAGFNDGTRRFNIIW